MSLKLWGLLQQRVQRVQAGVQDKYRGTNITQKQKAMHLPNNPTLLRDFQPIYSASDASTDRTGLVFMLHNPEVIISNRLFFSSMPPPLVP